MSLHQLLQECGGYDDGAGSDMDVCIGNDAPPAGSASAPPAGSTSAPLAGSTSSSLPQEDQAQGAGESADVSDGDGARPLREPSEERETPRTPTSAAGGAGGQGPEANDRTPTVSLPSVVCAFHGCTTCRYAKRSRR